MVCHIFVKAHTFATNAAKNLTVLVMPVALACGPSPTAKPPEHGKPTVDAFAICEAQVLGVMAVDPRIAARGATPDANAIHHVAMGAILAEDPTIAMEGDRPDVLSFGLRARALAAATTTFSPCKTMGGLEVELVARFLAAETFRLTSERDLPGSASTLLSALAATWRAPDGNDAGRHDEWLARRIQEIAQTVDKGTLTVAELQDLDDSLDPLERELESQPKSRAALLAMRLGIQRVTAAAPSDRWSSVAQSLAELAGTHLSAETLLALLGTEAKLLAAEIAQLVGVKLTDDVAARAGEILTAPPLACHTVAAGSTLRAFEPPEERAFDCVLRARTVAAHTADENLEVLVAMHDAIVTAAWAVVIARGGDARAIALAAPKRIAPMPPTLEGKLMRFATVHPASAITRALSIEWIMRNGLAEAALRADAWRTFGDAPLDIVERELHPRPREQNRLRQSGG